MSTPWLNQKALINHAEIHYRIEGEGEGEGDPMVLLHAGIVHSETWRAQFDVFKQHFRVLMFDFRGYGKSTLPDGPFSHQNDLHGLLQHLGIEKAILLGMSMGGKTAINFALSYPDKVTSLILVGAALEGYSFWDKWLEAQYADEETLYEAQKFDELADADVMAWVVGPGRDPNTVDPDMRAHVHRMLVHNYIHEASGGDAHEQLLEPAATSRIGDIQVPTLVLIGDHDAPGIRKTSDMLAETIPGAQKITLNNTAHLPNMEIPDEFNQIVLAFLNQQ